MWVGPTFENSSTAFVKWMTQNIRQRNGFCYFCSKNRDFHLAYTLNWFGMDHNLHNHKSWYENFDWVLFAYILHIYIPKEYKESNITLHTERWFRILKALKIRKSNYKSFTDMIWEWCTKALHHKKKVAKFNSVCKFFILPCRLIPTLLHHQ